MSTPKNSDSIKHNFYNYYLDEHQNINCRRLHFVGSSFGLLGAVKGLKSKKMTPVIKGVVAGYGCAWAGHFFFEKNKPATFKYPLKSFVSDFRMYADMLQGKVSLRHHKYDKKRLLINSTD